MTSPAKETAVQVAVGQAAADYQTIIDKYCRQLGKRAYEIDRLLEDQNLGELRAVLERKFVNYRELIDSFFASLNSGKNKEVHHA